MNDNLFAVQEPQYDEDKIDDARSGKHWDDLDDICEKHTGKNEALQDVDKCEGHHIVKNPEVV